MCYQKSPRTRWQLFALAITFLLSSNMGRAQRILELIDQDGGNFFEIQQEAEAYFSKHGTGKGSGYKLYKRWEYWAARRMDDDGTLHTQREHEKEINKFKSARQERPEGTPALGEAQWSALGPNSWTRSSSWSPGLGRITCIAVEETNQQLIYAGSPGGGIWKSTDAGQSWIPLGDDLSNMSIWSIAIDPSNNDIVYLGNTSGDVLKSSNGGQTWSPTGSQTGGTIKGILIDPTNTDIVFAVSSWGIFRSTNGGGSWTEVDGTSTEDIVFKPGSTTTLYACGGSFQRSTDAGLTWTEISSGFVSSERMKLEVTPAASNNVYLIQKQGSGFGRIYRSTDSGLNFSVMSDINTGQENLLGSQAGRDMAIAVSSTNPNLMVIGGLDFYRSTDAGVTFTRLAGWSQPNSDAYIHADVEVLEYVNGTLYCGTDGGIYRSQQDGNNVVDLTVNGLTVSQYYRIGNAQTNENVIVGGTQDNGTFITNGTDDFTVWLGADGMECFVDYTNANNIFGTSQYGTLYKSTNGGASYSGISEPGPGEGNWVTPFEIDPVNPNTIYVAYDNIYKSTNAGSDWVDITTTLDFGGDADEMALAPSDNNYIYVARGSDLWRTKNGQSATPTWNLVNNFSGNVNYITVDPNDPERLALACTSSRVYLSTNAGDSWEEITGNLPRVGAECVVFDDLPENGLYVGMGEGVYYRSDNATTWTEFLDNLPRVEITELEIHWDSRKIRAGTYGRGLWESPLYGDVLQVSVTANGATSLCKGEAVTLTATADAAVSYQWKKDGDEISGATSNVYTATQTGSYTVAVTDGEGSGESIPQNVTVRLENGPLVSDGMKTCGGGAFVLFAGAQENGTLTWYSDVNGTNEIGTGDSLVQEISSTSTFFVQETIEPIQYAGAVDSALGSGGFHNGGFYLVFDAEKDFTLKSALVYAASTADRTFELYGSDGLLIDSRVINVPEGASRVQLNFDIPAGSGYQIGAATGAQLYRSNSGISFPYSIDGLVTITESTASSNPYGFYYYLYNWEVEETGFSGCSSDLSSVTIEIVELPDPPVVVDATVCAPGGEVELEALGDANSLNWYDASEGGLKINEGATYFVEVDGTTSFFVEASNEYEAPSVFGAAPDQNQGGGGFHKGDFYLVFDVNEPFTLISAMVSAEGEGERTLELLDGNGSLITSKLIAIPDGESRIDIGWDIPVDTGYQIGFLAPAQIFRNNSGVAFPYDLDGLGTVTRSTAGFDYYYYLYDWELKPIAGVPCSSGRTEVVAKVEVCTGSGDPEVSGLFLYPNPTNGMVQLGLPDDWGFQHLSVIDESGRVLQEMDEVPEVVDFGRYEAGMYFLEIRGDSQYIVKRIVVDPSE